MNQFSKYRGEIISKREKQPEANDRGNENQSQSVPVNVKKSTPKLRYIILFLPLNSFSFVFFFDLVIFKKTPTRTLFIQRNTCTRNCAALKLPKPLDTSFRELLNRKYCRKLLFHCKKEWFISLKLMDANTGSSRSNEKRPLEGSTSTNEAKKSAENSSSSHVFVNNAVIAWHENRRKWVGDKSQRSQRMPKDPVISWSMTYEDLLLTNEPFTETISLPEMVDFLVDIWHDEGLYD